MHMCKTLDANHRLWAREGQIFLRLRGLIWQQHICIILHLRLKRSSACSVNRNCKEYLLRGAMYRKISAMHVSVNRHKQWQFTKKPVTDFHVWCWLHRTGVRGDSARELFLSQLLIFGGQIGADWMAWDRIDNINTEQTFSSSEDGLCKENQDDLSPERVTGLTGPHPESLVWGWLVRTGWGWGDHQASARATQNETRQRGKGHSTYCHQYEPSKQIDRQCGTGPSIAPYWDHNIIFAIIRLNITVLPSQVKEWLTYTFFSFLMQIYCRFFLCLLPLNTLDSICRLDRAI